MRVFTVVAMKTREQYGHGDAGAAVQIAGEGVPRTLEPEPDEVRQDGVGRPESGAPDRVRPFADAENGGPDSGVRGRVRREGGRHARSAASSPIPEALAASEEDEEEQSDDRAAHGTENERADPDSPPGGGAGPHGAVADHDLQVAGRGTLPPADCAGKPDAVLDRVGGGGVDPRADRGAPGRRRECRPLPPRWRTRE